MAALTLLYDGPLGQVLQLLDTNQGSVRVIASGSGAASANAPVNPTDDGSMPVANAGALVYTKGSAPNQSWFWNGAAWVVALALAAPANPADNNKLPIATNGNYTYALLLNANVDPAAAIAGTKVAPQFGAQVLSVTGTGTLQVGTSPATAGDFRVKQAFSAQGLTTALANRTLFDWGVTAADQLTLGSSTTAVVLSGASLLGLAVNGSNIINLTTSSASFANSFTQMVFSAGMTLSILASSTAGGAGATLTTRAQDVTGTGATVGGARLDRAGDATGVGPNTGGAYTVRPGLGTTGGLYQVQNGAGAARFSANDTGIGFYATAPVAKPTATGSRGGNAALLSLLTALAGQGLLTDSTSA